jgi:hypothetical protein
LDILSPSENIIISHFLSVSNSLGFSNLTFPADHLTDPASFQPRYASIPLATLTQLQHLTLKTFNMDYSMEDTQNSAPDALEASKLNPTGQRSDTQSVTKRFVPPRKRFLNSLQDMNLLWKQQTNKPSFINTVFKPS